MSNRRHFLKALGLSGAMMAAAGCTSPKANAPPHRHDFYGEHQSGIITAQQQHVYFIVLDLASDELATIKDVFVRWSEASAKLMQGQNVADYHANVHLAPADTGEADDLAAHALTLTFGVSAPFFDKLGISDKKPPKLQELPHFPRDQLQDSLTGGDICIQACSDDPQVVFHAVRGLVRMARHAVSPRWSQSGYNSFEHAKDTPRNLFGFKDGTANRLTLADQKRWLWVGDGWLAGGSYLVVRVVKMHLETWDRTSLQAQEDTFGRHRQTGAPIGQQDEFGTLDIAGRNSDGELVIGADSHAGIAKRTGQMMLRRSFSYSSGIDVRTGYFDAGLLFISFQKDPEQFSRIQRAFGNDDKMTEYTTHIGSGLFACFAGVRKGGYLGQALFDALAV